MNATGKIIIGDRWIFIMQAKNIHHNIARNSAIPFYSFIVASILHSWYFKYKIIN